MDDLPEYLKSGSTARLLPVVATKQDEQNMTSVFMAVFTAVPKFAAALLASISQKVGTKTSIKAYTEVVFSKTTSKHDDKPDGLIILKSGKKEWRALIEAKVGQAELKTEQIERYLRIAREQSIDAVITISNQFATRPGHTPTKVTGKLTQRVDYFHWSWKFIQTEAKLLNINKSIENVDQDYLLSEYVRFLTHGSAQVTGVTKMPSSWNSILVTAKSGGKLHKNSSEIEEIVSVWHSEARDLELQLSDILSTRIFLKLPRAHIKDPRKRLDDDCRNLVDSYTLESEFVIPDAASTMKVVADLKGRTIITSMTVEASGDRTTARGKISWLLKPLENCEFDSVYIRVNRRPSRSDDDYKLKDILNDQSIAWRDKSAIPTKFEIFSIVDDGKGFSGSMKFISLLEQEVPKFYREIGQHLRRWIPKPTPPKPRDSEEAPDDDLVS